jgi:predicted MFS family arabinose efflux permease
MNSQAITAASHASTGRPSGGLALCLLVAINLFNYIDRQVLAAVEPEIRRDLFRNGEDAKTWMGLLPFAFLITYMFLAPFFGWLADRHSRWKIVGIGVILWSLASGASGIDWVPLGLTLGGAYWALFATRCLVGVGEGAYGPAAPAMIADLYPVERRGSILTLFYVAIPVGGALGYAFGEIILKMGLEWRWAFYLVVPPGVLLGLLCFLMRDPPRGQSEHAEPGKLKGVEKYLVLFRIPSFVFNTIGMTAMTFAIGGLAYWMPDYLERHEVPDFLGIGPRTFFGALTAFSGLLATLSGGWLAEWLRPRIAGSYFLVSGIAMFIAFPAILGFLYAPFPVAWIFVFVAVFCLFFNTGPTNTILANVTHPAVRASGFALNILVIHLFGDAISPWIMGYFSDHVSQDAGFHFVAWTVLLGGVVWMLGTSYLKRDMELAPTRG